MQAANNTNAGAGAGVAKPILGVVFLILVVVGLYYLYQYLYGSSPAQGQVSILSGVKSAQSTSTDANLGGTYVSAQKITGIQDGGEYTLSFWVYIADTREAAAATGSPLVNLLEIGKDWSSSARQGNTLLYIGLDPKTGTLIVRQNTADKYTLNNGTTASAVTSSVSPTAGTNFRIADLISNYNTQTLYKDDNRCDILNGVEYQRWVLISVVANSRTLDVYIDGKLARSCIYTASNAFGDSSANAVFGVDNGTKLKGYFSSGIFANFAYTPDKIWALYQAGPGGSFSLTDFIKNLFNVNVTFAGTGGLQPQS